MNPVSRRDAMGLLAAGAATVGSTIGGVTSVNAEEPPKILPAFAGKHEPKPLPFDPAKMRGLSEKIIRSHWENNYIGSVKALNMIEQRLGASMREPDFPALVYGGLKREELHRTGSVVLHEHYFGNLGGDGKTGGEIQAALQARFGSYENWEAEFRRTGLSLAGGSGWCVLAYDLHTGEINNHWAWDHMHNAPTGLPLLVLDMYEHAFHMDYGTAAAKYVDAFMQNLNWEEVNRRYVRARKIAMV